MLPMNRFILAPLFGCLLILIVYSLFPVYLPINESQPSQPTDPGAVVQRPQAKVAKVSVIYGENTEYYERAIQSHQRHADRHGYPFHILRYPVAEGYWNKAEYLQSILVQELGKAEKERVEWLMWVDADSAIINPEIPVEIFLPSAEFDNVHFLVNKDHNGLNTGIFFCRVHPWTISIFTRTLGYPVFKPEVDLGYSADQTAMAVIFNETQNRPHVLYQPRMWYNTYQFHHGYEGKLGHLLVHFPGLEDDRFKQMRAWLQTLEDPTESKKWSMAVQKTTYPIQIEAFWKAMQVGNELLDVAKQNLGRDPGDATLAAAAEDLAVALFYETDQPHLMEEVFERVNNAIQREALGCQIMREYLLELVQVHTLIDQGPQCRQDWSFKTTDLEALNGEDDPARNSVGPFENAKSRQADPDNPSSYSREMKLQVPQKISPNNNKLSRH